MGFSKQCTKCGEVKWWYQFGKRKQGLFNLQSSCKTCVSQRSLRWAKKNQEKVIDIYRKWKEKNPEKVKEHCRNYYHKNKFIIKGYISEKIPDVLSPMIVTYGNSFIIIVNTSAALAVKSLVKMTIDLVNCLLPFGFK